MLAILGECEVTVASQAALFKFFPEHSTLTEVGKKRWRAAVQDLRVLIDRIQPHLDGGGGDGGDGVGDDAHECELDTRTMRTHTLRARTHHAHMRPRPRNTSPPLPPIRVGTCRCCIQLHLQTTREVECARGAWRAAAGDADEGVMEDGDVSECESEQDAPEEEEQEEEGEDAMDAE